jgi:hypothetical protein
LFLAWEGKVVRRGLKRKGGFGPRFVENDVLKQFLLLDPSAFQAAFPLSFGGFPYRSAFGYDPINNRDKLGSVKQK